MIKKEDIVEIGKFQKTHGLKGELNALFDVDADFVEDERPLIVEIDGILVPFFGESIRTKGSESFLIKLKGVDTQEKAQEFVNKLIYGQRSDLINYYDDPEMEVIDDFIGMEVVDSKLGKIGEVVDVDDSTANVLMVVETPDSKTVYIPLAEEFINAIDDDNGVIEMTLPEGLVDLNP